MPRQSRIVLPDVVHHVVARGVNGTRIFRNGFDKERYLRRVAIVAEREKVHVHGYCLMEMNAVRARIVRAAEDWPWSSARAHLRLSGAPVLPLTTVITRSKNSVADWRQVLQEDNEEDDKRLRLAYRSSRPCGSVTFVKELEERFGRRLIGRQSLPALHSYPRS